MQVKKFEAPTIQEALEVIKRELGPEAIILQTKKLKKGFGLMNKESVEVTAAVSERSTQKKSFAENRLRDGDREQIKRLPATRQGDIYDKYYDKKEAQAAAARGPAGPAKRLTATRYADIDDTPPVATSRGKAAAAHAAAAQARAQAQTRAAAPPVHQAETLEQLASGRLSPQGAGAVMGNLGAGMSVEEELRHLKRMIEEMKSAQEGAGATAAGQTVLATPALQDAFEQLLLNGVEKRYAFGLVKRAAFDIGEDRARNPEDVIDQLAAEVMETTEINSPLSGIEAGGKPAGAGPVVIALVGPTGVGKTTTVAKMASEALLKRNLKVGLINLDSYKVAAFDQLSTYAKILNCPFRSVATPEELRVALQDFQALDLVLVDTTGRSQRDPEALREMQELIKSSPEIRTHLVLAVATRDNELYDQATRFSIFRPQGIVFSKLDEATLYGSIYNVSQKTKLPLLYFTTGQRVPEDIEEATPERVAALIMDL